MTIKANTGLIGLGTMGAALALNIAENSYNIAVFNRSVDRVDSFMDNAGALSERVIPTKSLQDFVAAIERPRKIILMVPAGAVVDDQISALEPFLNEGDLIIDCGNANFHDTNRRSELAQSRPWNFIGAGVSGGEEGARFGPSIMVGCDEKLWPSIEPLMTDISAKHTDGTACAARLGEAGAGHFVKMVHNGIEYADMQMISEVYGILRDGHGWSAQQVSDQFAHWNEGRLKSYLIEITGKVAAAHDPLGAGPLIDSILDVAGQKGTGRWTAIEAQHLGTPVPVIEAAVSARNMSARPDVRNRGEESFGNPVKNISQDVDPDMLEQALIAGKIVCYAQGFEMLSAGAKSFKWDMPMAQIARIWRAGCIIRSSMLDDMASALERSDEGLVFDAEFTAMLEETHSALRSVVVNAISHGLPMPALSSGLAWFDQLRMARSTANMIQGQRDYFGLHSFERIDRDGSFHGPWADA